ncbi:hypothetical protein CB1_000294035 [Camelus ferus]|nr:hypothetical protein CB1_000294035 [Camelus ferus]
MLPKPVPWLSGQSPRVHGAEYLCGSFCPWAPREGFEGGEMRHPCLFTHTSHSICCNTGAQYSFTDEDKSGRGECPGTRLRVRVRVRVRSSSGEHACKPCVWPTGLRRQVSETPQERPPEERGPPGKLPVVSDRTCLGQAGMSASRPASLTCSSKAPSQFLPMKDEGGSCQCTSRRFGPFLPGLVVAALLPDPPHPEGQRQCHLRYLIVHIRSWEVAQEARAPPLSG